MFGYPQRGVMLFTKYYSTSSLYHRFFPRLMLVTTIAILTVQWLITRIIISGLEVVRWLGSGAETNRELSTSHR